MSTRLFFTAISVTKSKKKAWMGRRGRGEGVRVRVREWGERGERDSKRFRGEMYLLEFLAVSRLLLDSHRTCE